MAAPQDLDYLYSPSRWSKRFSSREEVLDTHIKFIKQESEQLKATSTCQLDVKYGFGIDEKCDIFRPAGSPRYRPLFAFYHGGYWQELSHDMYDFVALPLLPLGCTVISVGYDLAPKVTLDEIVCQARRSFIYIIEEAKKIHASGIYLCGHSSGGHLVAMILSNSWKPEDKVDLQLLKACWLVGGIYELKPLVNTYINEALQMTVEDAERNSPCKYTQVVAEQFQHCGVSVVVGENESPEFIRQAREYNELLQTAGMKTEFLFVPKVDHFNIIEDLKDPNFSLTQDIIETMFPKSKEK